MRILVAPQEFKGSLTAKEATEAIAAGLRRALPQAEIDPLPMADGGPGTLDALVEATGGRYFEADVRDPLGRPRLARWGGLGGAVEATAVVEMAEASGLVLLSPDERDPRRASTFGTGQLLRAALDGGYRRIIVSVGGSATNDGGVGAAQALGVRLLDDRGEELTPGGAALAQLARIDTSVLDERLRDSAIVIAADVTNPLCGLEGASHVYGPQKGADDAAVRELDAALAHFAGVVKRVVGVDYADAPGAGAAGGLGYGLMAFCGASVRPGFQVVAEAVAFESHVARADLIITGEGRLDRQSAFGKTTAGVVRVARQQGRAVVAIAGSVPDGRAADAFDAVFSLAEGSPIDHSMAGARELLEQAAEDAGGKLLRSGLLR